MAEMMRQHRIVVGVDGSPQSKQALRWALRQAELTGAVVEAINAWQVPVSEGWGAIEVGWHGAGRDVDEIKKASERTLNETLDEIAEPRHPVSVHTRSLPGHPAAVLIEAARGADLLVVGGRGHGAFIGALLGSVGQYCVHHAVCPVVVIREEGSGSS
jgi:nucleotide-binding universal stress UspA family protein